MNQKALDIFALRDNVINDYKTFVTSFTEVYAEDLSTQIDEIFDGQHYWPEPLVQINPNYKQSKTVQDMVAAGDLAAPCADIFRFGDAPFTLYEHQAEAIAAAQQGASYIVTTGTGSGKSLCYFIPIIDRILKAKQAGAPPKTRAIVIYPMNALANSQYEELEKYLKSASGQAPVTFAKYTGEVESEEREKIANNPPDILLTNFMMLEMLMTRSADIDKRVIEHCEGLDFLVLDELHTYRGRQGADVAMLIRRLKQRLAPENLQCIGTSATMSSDGSKLDRQRVVADVASKLFAEKISPRHVITETLTLATTDRSILDDDALHAKLRSLPEDVTDFPLSNDDLKTHPLAIWVERTLGVSWSDSDKGWVRAKPLTLTDAAERLAKDTGHNAEKCQKLLKAFLTDSSTDEATRTGNDALKGRGFFAFKLHQFISGTGHAYATLDPPGQRLVTVNGQKFHPDHPEKRLYPTHFCRTCGHEYHPVRYVDEGDGPIVLPRFIDDTPPKDQDESEQTDHVMERFGFLTLDPVDDDTFHFTNAIEDYPETWLDPRAKTTRLRNHRNNAKIKSLHVLPSGHVSQEGHPAWFLPGKFPFCLRCGETHQGATRDRNRLASLSAEGRSSATSVLISTALRWMHAEEAPKDPYGRKLLGFTDNRQDAALQAGHFNDFHFVSLLRSGFLRALKDCQDRGVSSAEIGERVQAALNLNADTEERRREWLATDTDRGSNLQKAEGMLRDLLSYRLWNDQKRGWRYANPSLEQLKLIRVEYKGLQELANDAAFFQAGPELLRHAGPQTLHRIYTRLFDYLRQGLAVTANILKYTEAEKLKRQSSSDKILPPWGFSENEELSTARFLMVDPPPKKNRGRRPDEILLSGSARSAFGKQLKDSTLWGGNDAILRLKLEQIDDVIKYLLEGAAKYGLVQLNHVAVLNASGWQLSAGAIRFHYQDPTATQEDENEDERFNKNANRFFINLYENLAETLKRPEHPLFGFESREHTAQVDSERRETREARFRYGENDRTKLEDWKKDGKISPRSTEFLPVLFCSPTMELGVDISTLNVVHLRNVPPTPANYAQRSGRAGRSGQAALVITYCAAQSPHDQNFFHDPPAMVHGQVNAPLLDLANQSLIDSHLQAIWLARVEEPLKPNIAEILELEPPGNGFPLIPALQDAVNKLSSNERVKHTMTQVLHMVEEDLIANAPWYDGDAAQYAHRIAQECAQRFDAAFSRWRDLLTAAIQQRDAGQRVADNLNTPKHEVLAARRRIDHARKQIDLLLGGYESLSSDFYSYRYLATEGFLPGYNFPRLPLMAYIPGGSDRAKTNTFIRRPRFLALSEFGPRSLVYHEGRSYRVHRAILPIDQQGGGPNTHAQLTTRTVRLCTNCGAGHFEDDTSVCHSCNATLRDGDIVSNIFRIDNVATVPTSRITANDEERQRQGFDLQTTFQWAIRDGVHDVRTAQLKENDAVFAWLKYGPSATITRLNKGLRRRSDQSVHGFYIDPLTGYWAKMEDDDNTVEDISKAEPQRIVPAVEDRKNALLFYAAATNYEPSTMATLQYALLRGIEMHFQLEESEVLGEPMPSRHNRRGILFYEAAEGGAGVLSQLVSKPANIPKIALLALKRMHYDIEDQASLPYYSEDLKEVEHADCAQGCYRCLLSYYNQMEHEEINRRDRDAIDFLLQLARHRFDEDTFALRDAEPQPLQPTKQPTGNALPEDAPAWIHALSQHGIPLPDTEPLIVHDIEIPYVWRTFYIVVVPDDIPTKTFLALSNLGFQPVLWESPNPSPDLTELATYFQSVS